MFWSSCPYEVLDVYESILKKEKTDLILFEDDIRINKKFTGEEKYFFETELYKKSHDLLTVKNWDEFFSKASDYSHIFCSSKIFPKTRIVNIPENIFEKMIFWDVGGADQLTDVVGMHVQKFKGVRNTLTKGHAWKDYVDTFAPENSENVKVVGSPQFDPFFLNYKGRHKVLSDEAFRKKYNLRDCQTILIAPTNPNSHTDMIESNLLYIEKILEYSQLKSTDFNLVLKTYPHDYLYMERQMTGVYKRSFYKDPNKPQYEFFRQKYPEIKIIESQDHHSCLKHSDFLFNIGGSHIAWETYFTNCVSFSFNYFDRPYFGKTRYLPKYVEYPDQFLNIEAKELNDVFSRKILPEKNRADRFFIKSMFSDNILNIVR